MTRRTLSEALAAFTALSYPQIKTLLSYPPYTLSTAQMPLAFMRFVEMERSQPSLNFRPGLVNGAAEFIVLIDPSRQNLQSKNYEIVRAIMEEIVSVWEANSEDLQLISYTIEEGSENVDQTNYYSVVAKVNFGL